MLATAMRLPRTSIRGLALGAMLMVCGCVALAAGPPVLQLGTARFLLSDASSPPALTAGDPVSLPDRWWDRRPDASGYGWYLLEWHAPSNRPAICAVYLTSTGMPTEIYVNGHPIGATGAPTGPPPRSWHRSQLFVVPAGVMRDGSNTIALRVYEGVPGAGSLGPVLAGPESLLRQRAFRDLALHTLGPAVVSVTITVLGLLIVVLWLRRRDSIAGLFGIAAILWGVHTGLSLSPVPLLPSPHWTVWWTSLYMLFVGLLCLFCLRFADVDWPAFRRFIVGFVIVVPCLLYVAFLFGVGPDGTSVIRLAGIALVFVALAAVLRYAWRRRDAASLLLLLAGGTSAAFAVHDWAVTQFGDDLRPVMLVPYAGLAFLILVGWMLTDRFVQALNESEILNTTLERRVAEKSEALNALLAVTRAARDAAEAADRAKTGFLAAASHDLRQPLHALGLFAARLNDRPRDADDAQLVHRIQMSVAALDSLFSALLDVSRLDAGAVTARPEPIALNALFDRMANDFAPEALDRGLKLGIVPTTLAVRSDAFLLERMLRNLIANALRYTDRGGVVVGARPRGTRIAIEVWDSGPGVAAENLEKIFEEFYRVAGADRERSRSLGLGLAIVRRLAQLLGHTVEVASRVGRGSVFRILAERVPSALAVPEPVPAVPIDAIDGRHILVIDDEESIREGMRQTLAAWGCTATLAASAAEAVAQCVDASPVDALLVDFRLGDGKDGLHAIAQVRSALGHDIPAVVVSGESSAAELDRIRAAGFMLLHKPVAPARMRAALSFLLARNAALV